MGKTPKEMMKAYVDSQKFSSTTEIMDAMKEMFRDVLQQVMESELDAELGYENSQRTSETAVEKDRRNYGTSEKQHIQSRARKWTAGDRLKSQLFLRDFSSSIQNFPEKGCKTPCHASRSLRPAIAKA